MTLFCRFLGKPNLFLNYMGLETNLGRMAMHFGSCGISVSPNDRDQQLAAKGLSMLNNIISRLLHRLVIASSGCI